MAELSVCSLLCGDATGAVAMIVRAPACSTADRLIARLTGATRALTMRGMNTPCTIKHLL